MKRIISYWLKQSPPDLTFPKNHNLKQTYLLFDGTYIGHSGCLICVFDGTTRKPLLGDYVLRENYKSAREMFLYIKETYGIYPAAMTLDGNSTALAAISGVWPDTTIQRCLVHIQRQGLSWLRRNPSTQAARDMRFIFRNITDIKSKEDVGLFYIYLNNWMKTYGKFVDELPKKDKVYSDLQRAKSLILNSLPYAFQYLHNPSIQSTTNLLESFFSRFKYIYKDHRGLRRENRRNLFRWYIYFQRKKR